MDNVYGYLADAHAMRNLFEKALNTQEREYEVEHQQVATTLKNLDIAYGDLGGAFFFG